MAASTKNRPKITTIDRGALPPKLVLDEAAQISRRSERALRRRLAAGEIKGSRPGNGRWLIDTDAFLAWLDGGANEAA